MTHPLARFASLFADPSRATFCTALLDGRAWTPGELAQHAGIAPSTASAHVTLLVNGGVLAEARQGRHRYVRIANPEIAALLEDMATHAPPDTPPRTLRESTRRKAITRARTCYDHLAGRLGVAITDALIGKGFVTDDAGFAFTPSGLAWLQGTGIEITKGKRTFARVCLDWTERRPHLSGAAGAALCQHAFAHQWIERIGTDRAIRVTESGDHALATLLGLHEDQWS